MTTHPKLDFRKLSTLYFFISTILITLLLAFLLQMHQNEIDRNAHLIAVNAWNLCDNSVKNAQRINAENDALVKAIKSNPNPSAVASQLIGVYEASVLVIPDCGPQP